MMPDCHRQWIIHQSVGHCRFTEWAGALINNTGLNAGVAVLKDGETGGGAGV